MIGLWFARDPDPLRLAAGGIEIAQRRAHLSEFVFKRAVKPPGFCCPRDVRCILKPSCGNTSSLR